MSASDNSKPLLFIVSNIISAFSLALSCSISFDSIGKIKTLSKMKSENWTILSLILVSIFSIKKSRFAWNLESFLLILLILNNLIKTYQ